jgi:hypothetical protein
LSSKKLGILEKLITILYLSLNKNPVGRYPETLFFLSPSIPTDPLRLLFESSIPQSDPDGVVEMVTRTRNE